MNLSIHVSAAATKRLLILSTAIASLVAATVVYAEVQSFTAGDTLGADKLNANFADLGAQIEATRVTTVGGKKYSLGAVYRGSTSGATGKFQSGSETGYAAGKAQCEARVGSATAHICTSEELVRSRQMGIFVDTDGWYSTGTWVYDGSNGRVLSDCQGWTTNASTEIAASWRSTGTGPAARFCNESSPITCCDFPAP